MKAWDKVRGVSVPGPVAARGIFIGNSTFGSLVHRIPLNFEVKKIFS